MLQNRFDIMVVDDSDADVFFLRRKLEDLGYLKFSFTSCRGGEDCEEKFREGVKPDLIFVDYRLGAEKGTELIQCMKGKFPDAFFIILTGMGDEKTVIEALRAGADDYLTKDQLDQQSLQRTIFHIQEKRMARRALLQAEIERDRLAMAVEQAAESVMITDTSGNIEYVNPAFSKITGYGAEEVIGKNPSLLKSGHHEAEHYRKLWATIQSGQVWSGQFINMRKDGETYHKEATISPIRDRDGQISHFVSVGRDISEQVKLEAQYRQAQKMEAVGHLAGGVAHDFNNLLQAIYGHVEIVKERQTDDPDTMENLDTVIKAVDRATVLVRQLLAFSRQQVMQVKDVKPPELVENLLRMLRRMIGEHIDLSVSSEEDIYFIHADPGQVEQALMNLCLNARDAMPHGGSIEIHIENTHLDDGFVNKNSWAERGDYVKISVSDTGPGISPEIGDLIFEPFFTTKEVGKGTGLGLATVYGIMKQHRGLVNLKCEIGEGACFELYFPAKKTGQTVEDIIRNESGEGGNEVLLLVEDDELVRDLGTDILKKAGYQVLSAFNGEEAITCLDENLEKIDLVILDVVLPKKNGKEVFEHIRRMRPDLPVLFCSGYGISTVRESLSMGENLNLVEKPFRRNALLKEVRKLLNEARSRI
ncbi:MAG: response regulator [Candidatus Sumerlaeota bacterium]